MKARLNPKARKQLEKLDRQVAERLAAEVLVNVPEDDDDTFSDGDMEDLMQSRKMWRESPESFVTIDEFMESRGISPE